MFFVEPKNIKCSKYDFFSTCFKSKHNLKFLKVLPDEKELYIVVSASRSLIPLMPPPGAAVVVTAPVKKGDV